MKYLEQSKPFNKKRLQQLQNEENSCVTCIKKPYHLSLFPYHLGDLNNSVKNVLNCRIGKYNTELGGIPLGYQNIKIIDSTAPIYDDSCFVHIDMEAEFFLFKPELGNILHGTVNKKSKSHLGCLLHDIFNVSIPKPMKCEGDWLGNSVQLGHEISFKIIILNLQCRLPYIRGELIDIIGGHPVKVQESSINDDWENEIVPLQEYENFDEIDASNNVETFTNNDDKPKKESKWAKWIDKSNSNEVSVKEEISVEKMLERSPLKDNKKKRKHSDDDFAKPKKKSKKQHDSGSLSDLLPLTSESETDNNKMKNAGQMKSRKNDNESSEMLTNRLLNEVSSELNSSGSEGKLRKKNRKSHKNTSASTPKKTPKKNAALESSDMLTNRLLNEVSSELNSSGSEGKLRKKNRKSLFLISASTPKKTPKKNAALEDLAEQLLNETINGLNNSDKTKRKRKSSTSQDSSTSNTSKKHVNGKNTIEDLANQFLSDTMNELETKSKKRKRKQSEGHSSVDSSMIFENVNSKMKNDIGNSLKQALKLKQKSDIVTDSTNEIESSLNMSSGRKKKKKKKKSNCGISDIDELTNSMLAERLEMDTEKKTKKKTKSKSDFDLASIILQDEVNSLNC